MLRNVRLVDDLRSSRERLVTTQADERRRLERNLHDGAQQSLVSVALLLRMAAGYDDPARLSAALTEASTQLQQAIAELRELARGIHPAILTDRGLGPALTSLAERCPVPVHLDNRVHRRLPPRVEGTLYFVVAEALTNVARYSQAPEVFVMVADEDNTVALEVIDHGVGGADQSAGSGLLGLADRVAVVDGTFVVDSPPGRGTTISCRVPVPAAAVPEQTVRETVVEPRVMTGGAIRTFMIADVRGYTSYTQTYGDEAAGRLAAGFAGITREVVEGASGTLLELRGDEALSVFGSARDAIDAAVALQQRFVTETVRDADMPLLVGIGIDVGEAVPVEGGYRGGALNLAARLCSLAAPGEILASTITTHLAGPMEGIEYQERGETRLKGMHEEVPVVRVHPVDDPISQALRLHRRQGDAGGCRRRLGAAARGGGAGAQGVRVHHHRAGRRCRRAGRRCRLRPAGRAW